MSKAIELAEAYSNSVSEHRLESLYGTSKSYTLEEAKERDEASEMLTAELRRLAAVEQENANLLAANKYSLDMMNQALQELADMKAAMCEPSHIKSKKQTAHELDAMKKYIEKITKDKDSAVGFLTRAGIIDGSGELAEQYRNIESKAKP